MVLLARDYRKQRITDLLTFASGLTEMSGHFIGENLMQYIIEPHRSYHDLETLQQDLALMDVQETPGFRLEQMTLTTQGTIQVSGIGEFPVTEIALRDALRRGGLHLNTSDNFFREKNAILDQVIVDAVNAYYAHSKYSTSEVKLITRNGDNGRTILGIPSNRYALINKSSLPLPNTK